MKNFPDVRLRRLRRTQTLRDLTGLSFPGPEKFVWPVFLIEGKNKVIPIDAMPGQFRFKVQSAQPQICLLRRQAFWRFDEFLQHDPGADVVLSLHEYVGQSEVGEGKGRDLE